jgi:hypothetical protein
MISPPADPLLAVDLTVKLAIGVVKVNLAASIRVEEVENLTNFLFQHFSTLRTRIIQLGIISFGSPLHCCVL